MKHLVVLLFLFSALTVLANDDSFYLDKDGSRYLCQKIQTTYVPNTICADAAYHGPFSKDESIELCQGSYTDAPARCAKDAYHGPFNKTQAVALCKFAITTAPADCATQAYHSIFNLDESVRLCARATSASVAECAINAYHGPYSKEESIKLCKQNSDLILRSLKLFHKANPDYARMKMQKLNLKK